MIGICFSLLLLVFSPFVARAQDALPALATDTTSVDIRYPDAATIAYYQGHTDFDYVRDENRIVNSWWDRFKDWLSDIFSNTGADEGWRLLFEAATYLIIIGLLAFGVFQLFKMEPRHFLQGRSPVSTALFDETGEDTRDVDFRQRAEEARAGGAFREAVRFYYLFTLKALDRRGVIEWHKRKTNHDYLAECSHAGIKKSFVRMTFLFDHAWYGNFPVVESLMDEVRALTDEIERQLGREP